MTWHRAKLVTSPPVAFTQTYYECYQDSFSALLTAFVSKSIHHIHHVSLYTINHTLYLLLTPGCSFGQRATLLAHMRVLGPPPALFLIDGGEAAATQGGVCGERGVYYTNDVYSYACVCVFNMYLIPPSSLSSPRKLKS
ncbi:hypothetical protein EON65_42670 [archaeon]|nr:MAG: hypothetical protein EON65_42670 [archaeon]